MGVGVLGKSSDPLGLSSLPHTNTEHFSSGLCAGITLREDPGLRERRQGNQYPHNSGRGERQANSLGNVGIKKTGGSYH